MAGKEGKEKKADEKILSQIGEDSGAIIEGKKQGQAERFNQNSNNDNKKDKKGADSNKV